MFSGIIKEIGTCKEVIQGDNLYQIAIEAKYFLDPQLTIGESICISGVCLTLVERKHNLGFFDIATETLKRTTLASKKAGDLFNIEPSLKVGEALSGHFVLGHVDIVTTVLSRQETENTVSFTLRMPREVAPFIAEKGSICLDGVSLTVGEISKESFSVYVVPHTLAVTTFLSLKSNDTINVEVDVISRYLHRLMNTAVT